MAGLPPGPERRAKLLAIGRNLTLADYTVEEREALEEIGRQIALDDAPNRAA